MTVAMTRTTPACVAAAQVFRSPLLEEPLPSSASGAQRQARASPRRQGRRVVRPGARSSPRACTKRSSRTTCTGSSPAPPPVSVRRSAPSCDVTVEPEDFDTLAGVTAPNRQVDHTEVVRLRNANPTESLKAIAQRLGCSLSTVKRHLRRARNGEVAEKRATKAPSTDQVLEAYASVIGTSRRRAA